MIKLNFGMAGPDKIFCPEGPNMIAIFGPDKYDSKFTCHISSSFAVFRPSYKFYSKTTVSCLGS